MTIQTSKPKKTRFAALIRVSTETQEDKGESLRVQTDAIKAAVKRLPGASIVEWYGGQEHGTPGWEKKEVNRLLDDAERGHINAVIIDRTDRWSRDNKASAQGLETFKANGVKFYVLDNEKDLFDPAEEFFINMNVSVGQYFAKSIRKESLRSKITRAKDGKPSCGGKLPYGRTYDKKTHVWGLDTDKVEVIKDIAHRYLAGERLRDLAAEYGMDYTNVHRTLKERCGPVWKQSFKSLDKRTVTTVDTKVPAILTDSVIKQVTAKIQANKTYTHGQIKNKYLLSRMVFCEHCGCALSGQASQGKYRYYRHLSKKVLVGPAKMCNRPHSCNHVNAKDIEEAVVVHLFEMFGNVAAIRKAIEDATPNRQKLEREQNQLMRVEKELLETNMKRKRIARLNIDGKITDAEANEHLDELNTRQVQLKDKQRQLTANLQNRIDPKDLNRLSQDIEKQFKSMKNKLKLNIKHALHAYDEMTWDDKRNLLETVLGGKTRDGKRMGVYINWKDKDNWSFSIHGQFIDRTGLKPNTGPGAEQFDYSGGGRHYTGLQDVLTKLGTPLRKQSSLQTIPFVITGSQKRRVG